MWNSSINVLLFHHFRDHFAIWAKKASLSRGFIRFRALGFSMCVLPMEPIIFAIPEGHKTLFDHFLTTLGPFLNVEGSRDLDFSRFPHLGTFLKDIQKTLTKTFAKVFDLKKP